MRRAAHLVGNTVLITALVALGVAALSPGRASADARPWLDASRPIEQRVDELLGQLTIEEEATLLEGVNAPAGVHAVGYVNGVPRLGIPAQLLSDGPAGVRDGTPATALPAPVSLAASFDPTLARQYGAVMGDEAARRGYETLYAPMINIVRIPEGGRNFETFGEDPTLAGQIGTGEVEGIQSQGVAAQVKHYAANNQEDDRTTTSSDVDERTLHEIYLPAFEDTVKNGRAWSLMCAYNKVNGTYACENYPLLHDILKGDWGFDGVVGSDYPATHSTVASAEAGLDQEFGGSTFYAQLPAAVHSGQLPKSVLDDHARRVLRMMFRTGLFDNSRPTGPPDVDAHAATARAAAADGSVLLKNNGVLPLDGSKTKSVAVIGPYGNSVPAGGGSSRVTPYHTVTPVQGLYARGLDVTYTQGSTGNGAPPPIPASAFGNLSGEYFANQDLSGTPALTRSDAQIDFDWGQGAPAAGLPVDHYSARWTGTLTAPTTGDYTLGLTSDDGSRLFVDGQLVIDNWRDQAANTETAVVHLVAGEAHEIKVEYYESGGDASVSLGWTAPGAQDPAIVAAVAAAKSANAAVVVVGEVSSEGSDRTSLALPGTQDALVDAVVEANPNTVVVLNTGGPVLMPWINDARAVLEMWYPGEEDGNALADLLFGNREPGGRLPVTFPAAADQTPIAGPPQYPAADGHYVYSEKLNVGYRWYDATGTAPLFPFGYGLGYTTFAYSNLHVSPVLTPGGIASVSVQVRNTGHRAGSEVVQLYVGSPASAGEPPKALKDFRKVTIGAGQSATVRFTLRQSDLAIWDTVTHQPSTVDGTYQVYVGSSSRNLRGQAPLRVPLTLGAQSVDITAPALATPGTTVPVSGTVRNTGDLPITNARVALHAPSGWTVAPAGAQRVIIVAPHGVAHLSWNVTVPDDAAAGAQTLSAHATWSGGARSSADAITAVNVPYASFTAAFNGTGISDDANPAGGNFDGSGYSYSAQALATIGLTPGATATYGGLAFHWPDAAAGAPDMVTAAGQTISLAGHGSTLGLLGAGNNGSAGGVVTVTYTDGTTTSGTATFADWYNNAAVPGCTLAATVPYWNRPPGGLPVRPIGLYATTVPLDPGKTVAAVTLPSESRFHVFGAAIG
ncbi:MAG TPA: glycoside hydrolase family 3 C-terminal domain-containing protein [Jatrophihabitantaceae bacterium]|jgi:beta-glucosidase